MTCREKLKIEKPHMIQRYCCGGCFGCPHEYGYLDRPDYCPPSSGSDDEKCTKCWDREIPGTEETKEKDMELNEKFAKMTFAELVDTAAGYEKEIENLREDNNRLGTMISNREDTIENIKVDLERKDEEIDRLIKNAVNKDEKISLLLKDNQYMRDANRLSAEKDKEKIESLKARLKVFEGEWSELKEKNESLEKDISTYRDFISMRDQRLDEKEAEILNMRETIDFYERHTNRIEGELKLYKGMKVDTSKTDYNKPEKIEPMQKLVSVNELIGNLVNVRVDGDGTYVGLQLTPDAAKCLCSSNDGHIMPNGAMLTVGDFVEPGKLRTMPDIDEMHEYKGETGEEPICKSVPSSVVIGKLDKLDCHWGTNMEAEMTFKLPKDAVKNLTGKDTWKDIEYLVMPLESYGSYIHKQIEEYIKQYKCTYYTERVYPSYYDSNPIPPVAKDYKAIAEHNFQKFLSLTEAGFTEDQAMSLIPMWTDDEEE